MHNTLKIMVLNGPNLQLLGKLDPDADVTLDKIEEDLNVRRQALEKEHDCVVILRFLQSNHEGELLSWVGESMGHFDGIIINPSTYAYTSLALANAIQAVSEAIPIYEVHLSKSTNKDEFRQKSLISEICTKHFEGEKTDDYDKHVYATALQYMVDEVVKSKVIQSQQEALRSNNAVSIFSAKAG